MTLRTVVFWCHFSAPPTRGPACNVRATPFVQRRQFYWRFGVVTLTRIAQGCSAEYRCTCHVGFLGDCSLLDRFVKELLAKPRQYRAIQRRSPAVAIIQCTHSPYCPTEFVPHLTTDSACPILPSGGLARRTGHAPQDLCPHHILWILCNYYLSELRLVRDCVTHSGRHFGPATINVH